VAGARGDRLLRVRPRRARRADRRHLPARHRDQCGGARRGRVSGLPGDRSGHRRPCLPGLRDGISPEASSCFISERHTPGSAAAWSVSTSRSSRGPLATTSGSSSMRRHSSPSSSVAALSALRASSSCVWTLETSSRRVGVAGRLTTDRCVDGVMPILRAAPRATPSDGPTSRPSGATGGHRRTAVGPSDRRTRSHTCGAHRRPGAEK
jgi:hypothetical protein